MNRVADSDFVYRADIPVDEIPFERVNPLELGIVEQFRPTEYTRVPSAYYHLLPPAGRLVLCLIFARDVFGEDEAGGWTKLGSGLTTRFGLGDRGVRQRAVANLERKGIAEVHRRQGATTLLRLKQRGL